MIEDETMQERVPTVELLKLDDLVEAITPKEKESLSALGQEISVDDAEELSGMFPKEIPKAAVEKHTTRSRIKEIFFKPKKLQRWRRSKR